MKKLNHFLLLGLVLMLIAGCSKMELEPDPLYSGDHTALKGAKVELVPFKSAFETWGLSEELIFPSGGGGPIGVHVVVDGSGKANHLGKTTIHVDQDWYFGIPMTGTSDITLTGANGDELFMVFTGEMNAMDPKNISIAGSCEIISGTGRFEDVEEGYLELIASFDKTIGKGETFLTGTIMY